MAMASEELTPLPLSMAESTIYTLVTTADVAKGMASVYGFGSSPPCHKYLLAEFEMHAVGERTPFVPVSKRIMDTLQNALEKYRSNRSPADIWIIFVEVPANDTREKPIRIHSAEELAEGCGHPNPQQFRHEALVEYSIPWDYVSHRVSLQTLMDRGLINHLESPRLPLPSYLWKPLNWNPPEWNPPKNVGEYLCYTLTHVFWNNGLGVWTMGAYLAPFIRMFGARAPLLWIANQLFIECLESRCDDKDPKMDDSDFELDDEDKTGSSSWSEEDLDLISDRVEIYLSEWLQGSDFVQTCTDFKDWEARAQDKVLGLELGFQKDWQIGDRPFTRTLSETDMITFDRSYRQLLDEIEDLLKGIETEAVRIGL